MALPTSIRFDDSVSERLASYAARLGTTRAAVAARFVDEGLRMAEHPGIVFRDGPSGRRASVAGGPDVWEVIAELRSARSAEPRLSESRLLQLVEESTGVSGRMLQLAISYWSAYPEEVDTLVEHARRSEELTRAAADRARRLLER